MKKMFGVDDVGDAAAESSNIFPRLVETYDDKQSAISPARIDPLN
jgi:hypothetical protein